MKTVSEILATLRNKKPELEQRFKVRRLALFGSFARGDQRDDSDIDILVDVDPEMGLDFVSLADELESSLGSRVDLVSTRAVKPRNWALIETDLIDV